MNHIQQIKKLWHINEGFGISESDIKKLQQQFGEIPNALADYYLALGSHDDLNSTQDRLVEFGSQIYPNQSGDYLIFYTENQYVSSWAIARTDQNIENPTVYETYDGIEWLPINELISEFLLSQAFMQRILYLDLSSEEFLAVNEKDIRLIRSKYSLLHSSNLYTGVDFYGSVDSSLLIMLFLDSNTIFFASDNETYLDEMWLNLSVN